MKEVNIKPLIKPFVVELMVNYLIKVALSKYFAGGHNFHGKYEYVPVESMQKSS
jgi:tripeptide aminopeptidase